MSSSIYRKHENQVFILLNKNFKENDNLSHLKIDHAICKNNSKHV